MFCITIWKCSDLGIEATKIVWRPGWIKGKGKCIRQREAGKDEGGGLRIGDLIRHLERADRRPYAYSLKCVTEQTVQRFTMHEMQSIFTDDRGVCPSVCLSVSLSVARLISASLWNSWLNESRCCLGWTLLGAHGTLRQTWVLNPHPPQRGGGRKPTFKFFTPFYLGDG